MRELLLSLSVLAGATAALAPAAHAAPVAIAITVPAAQVDHVHYYEDWRYREWRRREAYEHWRRHEERHRFYEHRHGWER